jgi:hypothetical protein
MIENNIGAETKAAKRMKFYLVPNDGLKTKYFKASARNSIKLKSHI